ncbi:MAG: sulfatase-like hydrolase/transferase [Planctomycetes bacterium]|nr:sulfatase-like hydrolase/transferase [Planctomycetota bacterium]
MTDRPNILWLMTDEQRTDSLGCAGAPWAISPNLDALAASGVRFDAAYTPSPVCISARACLLTGRAGSSIGVLNNHHRLAAERPGFLTWTFARAGWQVASFGKHHYACPRKAFDVEGGRTLGDDVAYVRYADPALDTADGVVRYDGGITKWIFAGRHPRPADQTEEMHNVNAALHWIGGRDTGRPFLLRVSLNAPHTPVVAPEPFDTMIDPDAIDLPLDMPGEDLVPASRCHSDYLIDYAGAHRLTRQQIRRARQCYYGRTAFADHVFGRLLDGLREAGELDNTIIAFVSDHGCHLGDRGFFQKQSFWEASARAPLIFAGPGIRRGAAIDTPVNAASLLPTLLELAGLDVPPGAEYPSLAPALTGGAAPAAAPVFSEIDYGLHHYRDGQRRVMVRLGRWKLVTYRDPRTHQDYAGGADAELFDLQTDPAETLNVLAGHPDVVKDLTAAIDAWDASRTITAATPIPGAWDAIAADVKAERRQV